MSRLTDWLDSPRLDKPLRVLLGAALFGYCAVVIFTRWVKAKIREAGRRR